MKERIKRSEEREIALRGIFQIDFHKAENKPYECINLYFESVQKDDPIEEKKYNSNGYAKIITDAVMSNLDEIDTNIAEYIKSNWSIKRIPILEKSVLRLCIAEMHYLKIPKEIAINEAVELIKKYGDIESTKYINGILNNYAVDLSEKIGITDNKNE